MASIVTRKGQVTIPKPVRERLGLVSGSAVEFVMAPEGQVNLKKVSTGESVGRFAKLLGRAGKGMSTDEIMELTRGEG